MWYLSFSDGLVSFSIIFSRFIHALERASFLFVCLFFLPLSRIPLCECPIVVLSSHLLMDTWLLQMATKHEKVLLVTNHQRMQIKTTMRYHITPVRMAIFDKQQVLARMCRKGSPFALLVGMHIGAATGKQYGDTSKN